MRKNAPHWISVLRYLQRFVPEVHVVVAPFEATQPGIGAGVGISRAHVALVLKELKARSLVEERLAHMRNLPGS